MPRRKFIWTKNQLEKLGKVKDILKELAEYKPLTLRQIYYQLVGKGWIPNNKSQYNMLSNLLKWTRINEEVSWDDIEDRIRKYHNLLGWNNKESFQKDELEKFLEGYRRDLLQTQDKYLEIWIEKDALASIFSRIARQYTVSVVVCRGFSSVSFLNDFKERLSYYHNKKSIMLYFGDFDPSGVEMLETMEVTLRDELNINNIEFKRIALQKEDIFRYKLPHNPDALKITDSRARKHIEQYGEIAVELDALRPDILERKIHTALQEELNMKIFRQEQRKEKIDLSNISKVKDRVTEFMHNIY